MPGAMVLLVFFSTLAQAEDFSDHLYNRQLVKQRERFKLSDFVTGQPQPLRWFATNRGSSYLENILGFGAGREVSSKKTMTHYSAGMYLAFFGVDAEGKHQHDGRTQLLRGNLRVLGSSQQDSFLSLFVGRQNTDSGGSRWEQMISGYAAQIYLFNQIGVSWRQTYLTRAKDRDGQILKGHEDQFESFAEYGAFRLFARYTWSRLKTTHPQLRPRVEALTYGLTFFF